MELPQFGFESALQEPSSAVFGVHCVADIGSRSVRCHGVASSCLDHEENAETDKNKLSVRKQRLVTIAAKSTGRYERYLVARVRSTSLPGVLMRD
jgi:hypothetical protein